MALAERLKDNVQNLWSRVRGRPGRTLDASIRGEMFGGDYGGYCVFTDGLDAKSIVYSFGIGEDLSFDRAMVERFGLTVYPPTNRGGDDASVGKMALQRPRTLQDCSAIGTCARR